MVILEKLSDIFKETAMDYIALISLQRIWLLRLWWWISLEIFGDLFTWFQSISLQCESKYMVPPGEHMLNLHGGDGGINFSIVYCRTTRRIPHLAFTLFWSSHRDILLQCCNDKPWVTCRQIRPDGEGLRPFLVSAWNKNEWWDIEDIESNWIYHKDSHKTAVHGLNGVQWTICNLS